MRKEERPREKDEGGIRKNDPGRMTQEEGPRRENLEERIHDKGKRTQEEGSMIKG